MVSDAGVDATSKRHFRLLSALIVVGVLILNLAVAASAELFLRSGRHQAEGLAAESTQSIARALDGSVSNAAQVTKLALRMVVHECARESRSMGTIDPAALAAFFRVMRASLPEGAMLHVTDRTGQVIFGVAPRTQHPGSYADRDFFRPLMSAPSARRIWVTNLITGRASKLKVIAFVARYDNAQGAPAGVVSIAIPIAYFHKLLELPRLGPRGIALIRDASTALIAIDPVSSVDLIGNRHFSPQLARAIASGERAQTFHAVRTGDGVERIDSFRRISGLPFYLVVGKSAEAYLAIWRSTRNWVRLAQLGFLVVSLAFAALLWGAARSVDALRGDEAQRARRDALTRLPNRLALLEYLPAAIARARRSGALMAVGMLDLDDFKSVNDRFGHAGGDALLIELSRRVPALVRAGDFVARLGGDEFLFVFEGLSTADAQAQLDRALARIHQAVERAFDLGEGRQARIGMSMGLALFPHDGEHAEALLRRADAAMYAVKQAKGTRKRWWSAADVFADA